MLDTKINNALALDDLILVKYLKEVNSPFINVIKNVFDEVKDGLDNRIPVIFPKYTLHNTAHSFRIINYMAKIIDNPTNLTELEIAMLICSALLHDVGMAVSQDDIDKIKEDNFSFSDVKYSAMVRLLEGDDVAAIQEYIRRIHGQLSARFVRSRLKNVMTIPDMDNLDFTEEVALICESHTHGFDWIKSKLSNHDVRGDYVFNAQYIAGILRLADILDIDGQRTPYRLYKLINPIGRSDEEWQQHFVISNNDKIVRNEASNQKEIVFHGKATNADTHRKILNYIDWVQTELTGCIALVSSMKSQYNLLFHEKPKVFIQAEGYTFSGYKMTLKFEAISALLMGEKIYGNRNLGLRELIQNSLDACRIRQENEQTDFGDDPYIPSIKVILDQEKGKVIIKDNGVGMSLDIIKNHFLNIGVSYYQSFDFLLKDLNYKPIGNFGIGFLSCFMLSDVVSVQTRHYKSKNKYLIQLEKGNEWTSLTEKEDLSFNGTEVILDFKAFTNVFENKTTEVLEFLKKFFLTDGIDFKLIDKPSSITEIKNSLNGSEELDKGVVKVSLDGYLKDIEGFALIKNKTSFIKNIDELPLEENVYIYQPLVEEDEEETYEEEEVDGLKLSWFRKLDNLSDLLIDNFLDGNQIKYLSIPIVDDDTYEDFTSGMKYTGNDTSEVIDKLSNKLKWISVLVPKEYQNELSEGTIDPDWEFLEGVDFSELVAIGHDRSCPSYKYVRTTKLFEGKRNELYLPFEQQRKQTWYSWTKGPRKELFIRSVLIKDFHFNLPTVASIFEVVTLVVNIKSRKFIPDISRNNIDSKSEDLINYVIGKAVHKAAIDSLELGEEESRTLKEFVGKFYNDRTDFENR